MPTRKSEALALSLVSGINMAIARLVDIWDSIGIMEDGRVERMNAVKKHIEGLLNDMIGEEEAMKVRLKTEILALQKQQNSLCLEMNLDPYVEEEGLTVLQMEKNLRVRVEALEKTRSERLLELQGLRRQDEELCVELCLTPYYIPSGTTPTLIQLADLRQHISTLAQEKMRRQAVFSGLRQDIIRLMEEMGHEPDTSLEKDSVCTDPDAFLLTNDNIKALEALCCQLEGKRNSLLKKTSGLKDRAQRLWSRLNCPEEDTKAFLQSVTGTLNEQVAQWHAEVEVREQQQKGQLEQVINKVREELVCLWDLCLYSQQQREAFNTHFSNAGFTEELLVLHDAELVKLQAYHDQAKPMLEALQRWEKNFALFLDFEKRANDPNRFSNRGGALLKETKERAKIQKILPKLEEDLRAGAELWLTSHGSDFLVKGQKVTAYISSQWDEHKVQKSKEKQEKPSKKGETTPLRTPTKRPHGSTSGPTPAKISRTPVKPLQRSNSSSGSTFIVPSNNRPPMSAPKAKRVKAAESGGSNPRAPLQEFNSERQQSFGISYSDFTSELSKKGANDTVLNSTVKDLH